MALALALVVPSLAVVSAQPAPAEAAMSLGIGLVDPAEGVWHLQSADGSGASFYFGNPGDYPIAGDWDCDGIDTPGMYRQADGFVYLRNSNTQGNADIRFFFGDPGDVPLAGDFNGDGCDTVSIYRPSLGQFFVINALGADEGGLGTAEFSYLFGNPGDKAFVGDFDGDGIDEVGLHRESTGFMYFRQTHTQGVADSEFFFGDPGDRCLSGDWTGDGTDTAAIFRPGDSTFYIRYSNTQGNADMVMPFGAGDWLPVSGNFGHLDGTLVPPPSQYSTEAVNYFMEVAIGHDATLDWYNAVWKWAGDVRVTVDGYPTGADRATVGAATGDINRVGGGINLLVGSHAIESTDLLILFTPSWTFPDYLPWTEPTWTMAWSVWIDASSNLAEAVILMSSDAITQLERDVMLRNALGATVGVLGTSHSYPNSVFFDEWRWTTTSYAPIDEEVFAILYDPRVQPGMTGPQVRAAVEGGRQGIAGDRGVAGVGPAEMRGGR